jgi:hypothetical protein
MKGYHEVWLDGRGHFYGRGSTAPRCNTRCGPDSLST